MPRQYVSPETIHVCEMWYCGQGSALYSIISLGYVANEEIAERAYAELSKCLRKAGGTDARELELARAEIESVELTLNGHHAA